MKTVFTEGYPSTKNLRATEGIKSFTAFAAFFLDGLSSRGPPVDILIIPLSAP